MFSLPASIKAEIERAYGQPLNYPSDCHHLASSIRDTLNETIGVTTLKRLLGFVSDVQQPRLYTLDILARYCGFADYEEMKHKVASDGDSEFEKETGIEAATMTPGSIVGFEYLPDRKIKLSYLGDNQFRVVMSENGSLQEGDVITVSNFVDGFPLVVGRVVRNGVDLGRYTAGKVSGISGLYLEEAGS